MKIKKLEYYDLEDEWKIEPVEFLPNLNLLVGISGAGKTSILKAIISLQDIANGKSLNGVKWNVIFLTDKNTEYRWSGEFEAQNAQLYILGENEKKSKEKKRFKIVQERLYVNNNIILDRSENKIIFNDKPTPKLSAAISIVELLSQEEIILPIKDAFNKIIFSQSENIDNVFIRPNYRLAETEELTLEQLKASKLSIAQKLFIVSQNFPKVFQQIKEIFMSIFTKVEDIKIDSLEFVELTNLSSSDIKLLKDRALIQIKERGVDQWIINNISSGMIKTLMFIAELYLSAEGSVILIDEFENSLGVNCLNSITDDILLSNHERQYIITSHHPYIINNISPEYWKIVTRKGGTITVHDAEDYHISPTRQKAFIELINVLEDFPEGLESA